MPRTASFSVTDLRSIFFEVLDRHTESGEAYVNVGSGFITLAHKLDRLTNLDVSGDREYMSEIMVMVTQLVCREAPIVSLNANRQAIGALNWTAITEFSVRCAVFFAREQGFKVIVSDIQLDIIARLLLIEGNWQQLKNVFNSCLIETPASAHPAPVGLTALPDGHGVGVAGIGGDSQRPRRRQLSDESYANLRSIGDQRHLTDTDLMMLIDEHFRPHLEPLALHYSETVSGEEWAALYDWRTSQVEGILCR